MSVIQEGMTNNDFSEQFLCIKAVKKSKTIALFGAYILESVSYNY